ncbi:hypothetical protein K9F62_07495 [Desulfovibrio sp. JY]|nr:hypothetical protein K9F62_07495 [Desulfovibrio sp. JY]
MSDPKKLAQSIASLYPEISKHGIAVSVAEDAATGDWLVTMTHGKHTLSTHLAKKDADDCQNGIQCVSLGIQIGRFVEDYCLGQGECPV